MKNYRLLVPLVLIVLFAASFYMLYDAKADVVREYSQYLDTARAAREDGVDVKAEKNYMAALELKPTLELYLEIGDFYQATGQTKSALAWGENMLSTYPKEAAAYEFQIDLLLAEGNYMECFKLANTLQKRGASSEKVADQIRTIEYEFYFSGEFLDVGSFSGGYCPVLTGQKWGYVDSTGTRRIASKFAQVGVFAGAYAPVVDLDGTAYFIDVDGNKAFVVTGLGNVTELGLMSNGIYSAFNGETWSFYDCEYRLLFGGYEQVSSIGNGVAAVKQQGAWSLLNDQGVDLTGKTYSDVAMDEKQVVYRNDRLFVNDGSGYQLIDMSGKVYGTYRFEAVHIFNDSTYAAVMIDDKWGFVNASGEMVIEPQYEDARSFSNGFAAVMQDDKWGFIDMSGKMVIEPQFENAKDFNDHGCVFVIRNTEWELLRLYKYNY